MILVNASSAPALSQNAIKSSPSAEETFKQGLQVFIALFGVVGHILVILIMRKQSRKKSTTDLYITTLSVADLLVLTVNLPLAVILERLPTNWPLGEFFCRYLYPIPDMFYGASVWTIVAIAVERYRGIVFGSSMTVSRAKKTSACLWAFSFMVFSLPLYFFVKYEENTTEKTCVFIWPPRFIQAYTIVLLLCSYVFPLVCICWTCVKVHRCLQKSNVFIKTMFDGKDVTISVTKRLSRSQERRLCQNRRANRVLIPVAVVFAVSVLPLAVLRTVLPFWYELYDQTFFPHLVYVAAVGAIINSAANPLVYSFSCREFRVGLKQLFQCRAV